MAPRALLVAMLAGLLLAGCSSPPPPNGRAGSPFAIDVTNIGSDEASGDVVLTVNGQSAGQTALNFPLGRHVYDIVPPADNFTLALNFTSKADASRFVAVSADVALGACQGKTIVAFTIEGAPEGVRSASVNERDRRCV